MAVFVARVLGAIRDSFQAAFLSRLKWLTWSVAVLFLLVMLLLAGALDRLPPQVRYPFPPGTVRASWVRGYVVIVITPHLVLNLAAAQVARAALLSLLYAPTITLGLIERKGRRRRTVAFGATGASGGALGLAFCSGPLAGLLAAVGLSFAARDLLWSFSVVLAIAALVLLSRKTRPEHLRPSRGT